MNRRLALLAFLVVAFTAGLGFNSEIAAAHGDDGTMTVLTAEQSGSRSIDVVVGLVYGNDGDPATEATVSVTGTGPDGAELTETRLPRQEGAKYGSTLAVPVAGTWKLTITSAAPEATADATVEVTERSTTVPATTAPATAGPSENTVAPAVPPTTGASGEPSAVADKDDSSNVGLIALVAGAVLVVLVAGALALRSSQARRTDTGRE